MPLRPTTLKLWRFLLDLYDVLDQRVGGMSSYEAATALQQRYAAMSQEDLLRHFGSAPDASEIKEGFPSQATVLRYVKLIEEDLRAFFPGHQLIPRVGRDDRVAFQPPNARDIQQVRHIGNGLFRQLDHLATEQKPLVIAVSKSVSYFLLPRVDVPEVLGGKFFLHTQRFLPNDASRALLAGDWDAAVGWENGYNQEPTFNSDSIFSRTLTGSECEVRLLIHPRWRPKQSSETTRNPFAARKWKYIQEHPEDPEGFGYAVTPEYLQGARLIFPDLPQVSRIGKALVQRKIAEGYQIDHFSSVVNAVRMGNGIGLVFGLPWLMRELQHEYHLISVGLKLPEDWGLSTRMVLRAFTRRNDTSEVTKDTTKAADNLVGALEGVLTRFGSPSAPQGPNWRLAGPANANEKLLVGKRWNVWFATSGQFVNEAYPRWKKGSIEFPTKHNKGQLSGRLYLENEAEPFMNVYVDLGALEDGFLMLRSRSPGIGESEGTQTSAYFPTRITREGYDGICFLGSFPSSVITNSI